MTSVVVPAHNEAAVIGRLLRTLLADALPGEFDVIVVANGCTDETATVAAAFSQVTVVSTEVASKHRALRLGDAHANAFPRLYIDADVLLSTTAARALAESLSQPGVLAVAPERDIAFTDRSLAVRWYYDIWQRLPAVQNHLWGRGVIGVGEAGHARLADLPELMSDDLAASLAFQADERRVVQRARAVIYAPNTLGDLLRRRVRALTGTAQIRHDLGHIVDGAQTSLGDLLRLMARQPVRLPQMAVFLAVTVAARLQARRAIRSRDYTTWLRDDSSRTV